jgi:hypothetical protein
MNKSGVGPLVVNGNYQVEYPFGPGIYSSTISQDFYDRLIAEVDRAREYPGTDQQENLAGNFYRGYSKHLDHELFQRDIAEHTANYLEILNDTGRFSMDLINEGNQIVIKSWTVVNLWANYQKAGDFNPIHVHADHLSFVIYTNVPKEIQEENVLTNSVARGQLYFTFGESTNFSPNSINYTPVEKKIIMFPASLRHYVWPFFSDVERVSISGNIRFLGDI